VPDGAQVAQNLLLSVLFGERLERGECARSSSSAVSRLLTLTAIPRLSPSGVAPTPLTELHIRGLTSGYEHVNQKSQ